MNNLIVKKLLWVCVIMTVTTVACQVSAKTVSTDGVLRMDYVLSGGTGRGVNISLSKVVSQRGRRACIRGAELPLTGNGQITVCDEATGDTIYRQSFSTLFQEWLTTGDTTVRAFENSFVIPMVGRRVDVELKLLDSRHGDVASHRTTVDPADILIRPVDNPGYDTVWVHRGSYMGPKIGVALLAEGYRAADMSKFESQARRAVKAILSHEPFKAYADRFDFVAVKTLSVDSGVSVPKAGRWRNTVFGSHFSTFYSDRYLTTPSVYALHDAMTGVPCEHIIVLANTDTYGGGGIYNSYTLTAAGNTEFEPVVVHEFGHSFGGLADEYFYENDVMTDTYPLDVEPWEPNITTLCDFTTKWEDLLADGTPVPTPAPTEYGASSTKKQVGPTGVYEGGGYATHGVYRPSNYCRMRVNDVDSFCPACQRALERLILFYTSE